MPRKKPAVSEVEQLRALVEQLSTKVDQLQASRTADQGVGLVVAGRRSHRGLARPWVKYVLLGVPSPGTMQPQAVKCCALLSRAADPQDIGEVEAMDLIRSGRDYLETVQDPWRVFQYYRAKLIRSNYLRMPNGGEKD